MELEELERMKEIQGEIESLLLEAYSLVPKELKDKVYRYWYAHILTALFKETDFVGGWDYTLEDTINDIEEEYLTEDDNEEDEDELEEMEEILINISNS